MSDNTNPPQHPDPPDDYLWDKTGEPDPTVVALEELLGPLGHHDAVPLGEAVHDAHAEVAGVPAQRGSRPATRLYLVAAAVVVTVGASMWLLAQRPPESGIDEPAPIAVKKGSLLKMVGRAKPVSEGETVVAGAQPKVVDVADYGSVTVPAGGSIRVKQSTPEGVLLELPRGTLDVDLLVTAPPRFFQVDTPAGRVVDLGCIYRLTVDDAGALDLDMKSGWVVIEHAKGRVVVPGGATARSTKADGPTIPTFDDAVPAVFDALQNYEQANAWEDQRSAARDLLSVLAQPHDTLIAWHMLDHADAEIAGRAHEVLSQLTGDLPKGVTTAVDKAPTPTERELWLNHLYEGVWTAP